MIAVVGSRALPLHSELVSAVAAVVATDNSFGVRSSIAHTITSSVEAVVVQLAGRVNKTVRIFEPIGAGRDTVYERDFRLVEAATKVIAFFPWDEFMEGGTGHVVKAAIDRGIEIEAYAVTNNGEITLIASDDAEVRSDPALLPTWRAP